MPETLTDSLLGRLIDGRYEVRNRLASGGMATVYLAFDRRLERMVAVKVMHTNLAGGSDQAEFAARFRREAKAAARLTHPGMVRVYDQGTDGDMSYLTMEYVAGENLRAQLQRKVTLPVGGALDLVEGVLDALAAVHRQGLVHRDVKPENILIDPDGATKLADFGLARAVTEMTATSSGTLLGTVTYLAPEVIQTGNSDARGDVYAVGVILFEALTGRKPFTAPSAIEVAQRHVNEDVPPPSIYVPWLPAEIDALVTHLTARNPESRPADAAAALARVRRARAMIDDPTLDRRAEPPSGAIATAEATEVLSTPATGATIALPIGLGTTALPVLLDGEDDPEATEPSRDGRRVIVWIAAVAAAVVAMALIGAWWYNTQGPGAYTTVPPVEGWDSDAAKDILVSAGLEVTVRTDYSDDVPEGLVISTDPEGQSQIIKHGEVTMVVSLGQRMVTVPEVVNRTQEDALKAIDDAGFPEGNIDQEYSDTVPDGTVISVTPEAGTSVAHNTPINLVVSKGPAPVKVPDVIGFDEARARKTLEDAGLTVITSTGRSLDVDKGEVFATDPAVAADTFRTATITIFVSEGKPLVEVPNFINLTVKQAKQQAKDAGLELEFYPWLGPISGDVADDKKISDQNPGVGQQVEYGSTIVLEYRNK